MHVLAPCVPQGEAGNLQCATNSAWVTWLQAMGAESYSVLAVERGGANSSCSATDLHCNVPDLLCGATYTFHITAVNSFCHSRPSNSFQIQTGANTLKQPNLPFKNTDCNSQSFQAASTNCPCLSVTDLCHFCLQLHAPSPPSLHTRTVTAAI